MPRVPLLRPREVVNAFERCGWRVVRQRGSHTIMTKDGSVATLSVPQHDQVARGTLRGLIDKAGLSVEQFIEILNS
jgi:predicted RNA binding protein YcfA (HicA-like mRNA interferase family)